MSPLNARMKSTSLSFRRSGVQSHATLGNAEAIQSERSQGMACWLALREKRSECFLRSAERGILGTADAITKSQRVRKAMPSAIELPRGTNSASTTRTRLPVSADSSIAETDL
jgi:hypothetical protein